MKTRSIWVVLVALFCASCLMKGAPSSQDQVSLRAFVASRELAAKILADPTAEVKLGARLTDENAERFIVILIRNDSKAHVWGTVRCTGPAVGKPYEFTFKSVARGKWNVNIVSSGATVLKPEDGTPVDVKWVKYNEFFD